LSLISHSPPLFLLERQNYPASYDSLHFSKT
jgi:hypothetical protein